ncbi:hypothetical protein MD484_g6380, partial [Candolleomyces efflorescens]
MLTLPLVASSSIKYGPCTPTDETGGLTAIPIPSSLAFALAFSSALFFLIRFFNPLANTLNIPAP